jgi:hypothetical protein
VQANVERSVLVEIIDEAYTAGVEDVVNELFVRDVAEGRTPLTYAVAMNMDRVVRDLIELGKQAGSCPLCSPPFLLNMHHSTSVPPFLCTRYPANRCKCKCNHGEDNHHCVDRCCNQQHEGWD